MTEKNTNTDETAHLRRRAEKIVRGKALQSAEDLETLSPEEARRMLHKLRVHQIEWEMQNEELRRAQTELDAVRARYFELYDIAPVGYCTLSAKEVILEANCTAATLLGVARNALTKQPMTRYIVTEDLAGYYRHRKLLLETGEPQTCELRIRRLDGTQFWAQLQATVAQDTEDTPVSFVTLHDISERRQIEEALRNATTELVRSNEELEQFVYVASHDLLEPLRAVSGYISLLEEHLHDQLDAEALHLLNGAIDGAKRMQLLITDLLALSHVGSQGKAFVTIDIGAVLEQVKRSLCVSIQESGVRITHDPLPRLSADAGQLVELFQNLINNAIKFRGDDTPAVHIGVQRQQDQWCFAVHDNGIGIEPQYYQRIFLIFQRLHTRTQYPGTGIGLAICKKIVERHGGTMWIDSSPGDGSTFFFTIPDKGRATI